MGQEDSDERHNTLKAEYLGGVADGRWKNIPEWVKAHNKEKPDDPLKRGSMWTLANRKGWNEDARVALSQRVLLEGASELQKSDLQQRHDLTRVVNIRRGLVKQLDACLKHLNNPKKFKKPTVQPYNLKRLADAAGVLEKDIRESLAKGPMTGAQPVIPVVAIEQQPPYPTVAEYECAIRSGDDTAVSPVAPEGKSEEEKAQESKRRPRELEDGVRPPVAGGGDVKEPVPGREPVHWSDQGVGEENSVGSDKPVPGPPADQPARGET